MSHPCSECGFIAGTADLLELHLRTTHDDTAMLRFSDGGEELVDRWLNSKFPCPCGAFEDEDTHAVAEHAASHLSPPGKPLPPFLELRNDHLYSATPLAARIAELVTMLQSLAGKCALCWMLRDAHQLSHPTYKCAHRQGAGYGRFRSIVQLPVGTCWFCGLPYAHIFHTQSRLSDVDCEYNDVVFPIAWMVWANKEWRERAVRFFNHRGRDRHGVVVESKLFGENEREFGSWLSARNVEEDWCHVWDLVKWVYYMVEG